MSNANLLTKANASKMPQGSQGMKKLLNKSVQDGDVDLSYGKSSLPNDGPKIALKDLSIKHIVADKSN